MFLKPHVVRGRDGGRSTEKVYRSRHLDTFCVFKSAPTAQLATAAAAAAAAQLLNPKGSVCTPKIGPPPQSKKNGRFAGLRLFTVFLTR